MGQAGSSLQVIALAVVGGVVSMITFSRQQRRLDDRTSGPAPGPSLSERYEMIEKYLNTVISEYKRNRHLVVSTPAAYALDGPPERASLIGDSFVFVDRGRLDEAGSDTILGTLSVHKRATRPGLGASRGPQTCQGRRGVSLPQPTNA